MKTLFIGTLLSTFLFSCTSDKQFKEKVKTVLLENPKILQEIIEKNPELIMTSLQNASRIARSQMAKKREQGEIDSIDNYITSPLKPSIRKDESFRGTKDAKITLVEYSDFQCPYCLRGAQVVDQLLIKYKGKIRFIYKHLPLSFHSKALISAQYYEAIRLQDPNKAFIFHDKIFENQRKLSLGVKFLNKIAKDLKVDMKKLKKDYLSKKVNKRINEDIAEAKKFKISGTPGFILNGVPIKGAYPEKYFISIIAKLEKAGKI